MRGPQSLQGRLALWLGLGVTLLWALAAGLTAERLRREMDVVFDSALEETGQRLLPLAIRDIVNRDADDSPEQGIATLREHDEYLTWIVRDREGAVLLRSHQARVADFPPFAATGFADTGTLRIYSDSALQGTITIAVAEPLAHRRAVAWAALSGLALPLGLLLPASLLGIWLVVRLALSPLKGFRAEIAARGAGDLAPIATDGLPAEFRPNAIAVNQLLLRLKRALAAERSFTANSAHELRTPVAAALAQVQRLILESPEGPVRARARQIEAALHRLSRLAEKLMHLARAEGGGLVAAAPVDLVPILKMVIADMPEARGRVVTDLPAAPAMAGIDADAFAILARNLIENALKHGDAEAPVTIALGRDGSLRVANAGPAVAAEVLSRLALPFARGETAADGSGLGLAIARTIAEGSGGRLELISPREGAGDGFEARFHPAIGRPEPTARQR